MANAECEVRSSPLIIRDGFVEIARYVDIREVLALRRSCRSCAQFAGDASLHAWFIEREGWETDFKALRPWLKDVPEGKVIGESDLAASVEARYCWRRHELRLLLAELPGTWSAWGEGASAVSRPSAAALAQTLNELVALLGLQGTPPAAAPDTGPPQWVDAVTAASALLGQEGEVTPEAAEAAGAADAEAESQTRRRRAAAAWIAAARARALDERSLPDWFHVPGDLVDIMQSNLQAMSCGALALFERLEVVTANPCLDVFLVVEARFPRPEPPGTDAEVAEDSDDEDQSSLHRIPAALASWNLGQLEKVSKLLLGKRLELPPDEDLHAQRPMRPPAGDSTGSRGLCLVERGHASFDQKARNAAAGGFVGVLVSNNKAESLCRMGHAEDSEVEDTLLPAMFLSQESGCELRTLISKDAELFLRDIEERTTPRGYVRIGREISTARSSPGPGSEAGEILLVCDSQSASFGQVLFVPKTGPSIVLAKSLLAFLQDIAGLDADAGRQLRRYAPEALKAMRGERGGGACGTPGRASSPCPCSGFWKSVRAEYVVRVAGARRVTREWLHVDGGPIGFQCFRVLRAATAMSVESLFEACDLPEPHGNKVYIPSTNVDVLHPGVMLVEAQTQQAGAQRVRRGYCGTEAILRRISMIAPSYVKERWQDPANHSTGIESCIVSFQAGQMRVKWSDHTGYRGSFQKPIKSLFEVLVEHHMGGNDDPVLEPGQSVLVPGGRTSEVDSENGFGSGWEGEDNLDEPDGVWCLRSRSSTRTFSREEGMGVAGDDDVVESHEDVVVLKVPRCRFLSMPSREELLGDFRGESSRLLHQPHRRRDAGDAGDLARRRRRREPDAAELGAAELDGAGATSEGDSHASSSGKPSEHSIAAEPVLRLTSTTEAQIEAFIPGVAMPEDFDYLDLEAASSPTWIHMVVHSRGQKIPLKVQKPFTVDVGSVRARFSKKRRRLIILFNAVEGCSPTREGVANGAAVP